MILLKNKNLWTGFFAAAGILILIFDGETAIKGTQDGIGFCLNCVIPSLFPFFLLTNLMTKSFSGIPTAFLHPLRSICSIPAGSEAILFAGILGGYPAGAQAAASAFRSGSLQKDEASRMLGYCNNAGPAFIFGMLGPLFPHKGYVLALWGIHIAGALTAAFLLPPCPKHIGIIPGKKQKKSLSLPSVLRTSIHAMTAVCGWIIVFRIILSFGEKWIFWCFPKEVTVLITGLLELTNGCQSLYDISGIKLRFILCSVMLSFGGLCVVLQTRAVAEELNFQPYITGKLIQTFVSLSISCATVCGIQAVLPLLTLLFLQFFQKGKNMGSNLPFLEI